MEVIKVKMEKKKKRRTGHDRVRWELVYLMGNVFQLLHQLHALLVIRDGAGPVQHRNLQQSV